MKFTRLAMLIAALVGLLAAGLPAGAAQASEIQVQSGFLPYTPGNTPDPAARLGKQRAPGSAAKLSSKPVPPQPTRTAEESSKLPFTATQSFTTPSNPTVSALADTDPISVSECRSTYSYPTHGNYWIKNHYNACQVGLMYVEFQQCTSTSCTVIGVIQWRFTILVYTQNNARQIEFVYHLDQWAQAGNYNYGEVVSIGFFCVGLPALCTQQSIYHPSITLNQLRTNGQFNAVFFLSAVAGNGVDVLSFFQGQIFLLTRNRNTIVPPVDFRCDKATYINGGACIFHNIRAHWGISLSDPTIQENVVHINDAFTNITATEPGNVGSFVPGWLNRLDEPIQRNYHDTSLRTANRTAAVNACRTYFGEDYTEGGTKDCDEYPFASTYQGAATVVAGQARSFSVRPIDKAQNQMLGSRLGTWYTADNILDGDPFWIEILP